MTGALKDGKKKNQQQTSKQTTKLFPANKKS